MRRIYQMNIYIYTYIYRYIQLSENQNPMSDGNIYLNQMLIASKELTRTRTLIRVPSTHCFNKSALNA
jgi:hypothetical protein